MNCEIKKDSKFNSWNVVLREVHLIRSVIVCSRTCSKCCSKRNFLFNLEPKVNSIWTRSQSKKIFVWISTLGINYSLCLSSRSIFQHPIRSSFEHPVWSWMNSNELDPSWLKNFKKSNYDQESKRDHPGPNNFGPTKTVRSRTKKIVIKCSIWLKFRIWKCYVWYYLLIYLYIWEKYGLRKKRTMRMFLYNPNVNRLSINSKLENFSRRTRFDPEI